MQSDTDLRNALAHIDVILSDGEKIRYATDGTNYPNFAGAGFCLFASEAIAMIIYGWPQYTRSGKQHDDGRGAVFDFWRDYFPDSYNLYPNFIWGTFRNKILHIYKPTKVTGINFPKTDNRFLTGVSWNEGSSAHLAMQWDSRGERPYLGFDVVTYLDDMTAAVSKLKVEVEKETDIRTRLLTGWDGHGKSMRINLDEQQTPELVAELEILTEEVRKIYPEDPSKPAIDNNAVLPSPPPPEQD